MAHAAQMTDDLLRFVDANVESIEDLEVLRIVGEDRKKWWLAEDLARDSQIQTSQIAGHLNALETRGLVTCEMHEGQLSCIYSPRTAQLDQLLSQLLQFYRERPVTLIKLVYARANDRLKAFADAFRLRKET